MENSDGDTSSPQKTGPAPTGPVTRLPRGHGLGRPGRFASYSTTVRLGPGPDASTLKRFFYFLFSLAVFAAILASAIFLTGVFLAAALIVSIPLALLGLLRSCLPGR